jgi:hypothetical protein
VVSVRAPINRPDGADALCRQFETGGGRKAAAGINQLPDSEYPRFVDAFLATFGERLSGPAYMLLAATSVLMFQTDWVSGAVPWHASSGLRLWHPVARRGQSCAAPKVLYGLVSIAPSRVLPCSSLGAYPGLISGGRTAVSGELYRVDRAGLKALDLP